MTPIPRSVLVSAALAVVLLAGAVPYVAANGLDPTFGGDGVVMTPIGDRSFALAVVRQNDGKVVAAGRGADDEAVALVRYLTSGSLDPSFGTGGIVTTDVGAGSGASALVLQSDDKLVVAGYTTDGVTSSILVARYESDGTLDAAFGMGGVVVTPLALTARAEGLGLQSDGKIVVAGTVGQGDTADVVVLRYEVDGTLDVTFDTDGIAQTDIAPPGCDLVSSMALQSDDGIVVAASRSPIGGGSSILALLRYTATGALDPTFGSGGIVLTSTIGFPNDVLVQPDQKIVLGANNTNIIVKRFLTDGSPDTGFADNGTFVAGGIIGTGAVGLTTIAYQDPDRLLLGGAVVTVTSIHPFLTSSDVFLSRLIDDGHATDVGVTLNLGSSSDNVNALVPLTDGRIVGAGSAASTFTVFRYEKAVCGDGVIGGGETCDDSNTIDGDGCDHNCQPTGCGNGVVTAGEICDDGNTVDGDCCSSTCQYEAAGTICSGDENVCTDDVCNAGGVCTHLNNTASCNDGNRCTVGDVCNGGTCVAYPMTCPLCETCDVGACVGGPRPSCRTLPAGASARLQIRDKTPDKGDQLQWKRVKAVDTPPGDFGSPLGSTQYALCVFDESSSTPTLLSKLTTRQGTCGTSPCWKTIGTRGWKYKDKLQTPDGVDSLLLKGTVGGSSTLAFNGRGANLPLAALPLPLPARVQLQATNGSCWEATYSGVGVQRNDATQFKGGND